MLLEERPVVAEQPAGGLDPDRFDWQEVWYPIAYVRDLNPLKPLRFTLLDRDLVIWWDRQETSWRVMDDRCPHRLVPLSEGRIAEDGLLECPYHGWAFRGDGTCDRIPQQLPGSAAHESPRACLTSLPTAVRQGLLFVYPGQAERANLVKIPLIEPMEDQSSDWVCIDTFRDLPYDALTLLENVLDSSHLPFTHHRSVGNRANAAPVELEVLESGKTGFRGFWAEGPRKGKLGSQETVFLAPGLMWHDLTSKQFGRTLTVVYATPIRKGECRLFARFPFKFNSAFPRLVFKFTPRWFSHIGQNRILEDDQIFLHVQERNLLDRGGSPEFARAFYLPTRADTFVVALHRWLNDYKAQPFPGQALPPRRSIPQLLDRYSSHTVHCADCRQALTTIQGLRQVLPMVGLLFWAVLSLIALGQPTPLTLAKISAILVPPLLAGFWLWLGNLERQFYEGQPIPARNQPGK